MSTTDSVRGGPSDGSRCRSARGSTRRRSRCARRSRRWSRPARAGSRRRRGCGRARAAGRWRIVTASGCSRMGWPGRVAVLDSHSTTCRRAGRRRCSSRVPACDVAGALGRWRRRCPRRRPPCSLRDACRSRAASRSSGVLSASVSTPGSARLARSGQRAGRRHLDDPGDAELGHRLHAQVPAHRVAHLADEPVEHLAAARHHVAVAVGEQPACAGRARRHGPGVAPRAISTAGAMCSVWNAPATYSGMTRALAGGSAAKAASCSSVPAATTWPAPLLLAAVSPCRSRLAARPRPGRRPARRSCRSGLTALARRPSPGRARGPAPSPARR